MPVVDVDRVRLAMLTLMHGGDLRLMGATSVLVIGQCQSRKWSCNSSAEPSPTMVDGCIEEIVEILHFLAGREIPESGELTSFHQSI
jgi:molybdopterin/thiamine biosynthesis adenylyltransferase